MKLFAGADRVDDELTEVQGIRTGTHKKLYAIVFPHIRSAVFDHSAHPLWMRFLTLYREVQLLVIGRRPDRHPFCRRLCAARDEASYRRSRSFPHGVPELAVDSRRAVGLYSHEVPGQHRRGDRQERDQRGANHQPVSQSSASTTRGSICIHGIFPTGVIHRLNEMSRPERLMAASLRQPAGRLPFLHHPDASNVIRTVTICLQRASTVTIPAALSVPASLSTSSLRSQ